MKATTFLNWQPKAGLSELVSIVVDADEQLLLSEQSGLPFGPHHADAALMNY